MKLIRTVTVPIALVVAILGTGNADAQQICYSYDLLGRLTGVIDQNNQAPFYDYDSVGNILAIRRESPAGAVNILSIHPPGGVLGTRVELFGYGLSTTPNQNQVTLNGIPLNVVSANRCHLLDEDENGSGVNSKPQSSTGLAADGLLQGWAEQFSEHSSVSLTDSYELIDRSGIENFQ
jgi:YD repeat-containing protein